MVASLEITKSKLPICCGDCADLVGRLAVQVGRAAQHAGERAPPASRPGCPPPLACAMRGRVGLGYALKANQDSLRA